MRILSFFCLLIFNGLGIVTFAQPEWSVNAHSFEFSMNITAVVTIDGQISTDKRDKISAFVDSECRGVANIQFDWGLNGYFIYMMVYGNKMGEKLTFYVFDASRNEILTVQNSLSFTVNNIIGSPDEPYQFNAASLSTARKAMEREFKVYPVPLSDVLHVDFPGITENLHLKMYASDGRLVTSAEQEYSSTIHLDTQFLTPGIYWLVWQSGCKTGIKKLIKY